MQFEWNERKDRSNKLKHKVSFAVATLVFEDPGAISTLDTVEDGEECWLTLGSAGGIVLLLVAHTYREDAEGERIRIVSARKATPRERQLYEENL
jgi:uncharacterized protein